MKRRTLPPSQLLTLPTAAAYLGWDVEQIEVMESIGEVQTISHEAGGRVIKVVTLEEVARLQSATVKQPERYNPTERKGHLYLIGLLASVYDPGNSRHYQLRDTIESDASAKGLGMLRKPESDALTLQEALDLVASLAIKPESAEKKAA